MYLKFIIFLIVSVFIVNPVVGPDVATNQALNDAFQKILRGLRRSSDSYITLEQFLLNVADNRGISRTDAMKVVDAYYKGSGTPFLQNIKYNDFYYLVINLCSHLKYVSVQDFASRI
ncbi:uncharacterized protein LOC126839246 [Adelges cooleyi]|uniref:uncharacterized protein LOC126839246 n=1 Tax=Adelges cooleyi TaxID=133065 RepID=UPI00217F9597|nr:uncharacterized protein LOC126839246 [Adelges cooleyi]